MAPSCLGRIAINLTRSFRSDIELSALLQERLWLLRKAVRRDGGRSTAPGGCYAYVPVLEPTRGPSV